MWGGCLSLGNRYGHLEVASPVVACLYVAEEKIPAIAVSWNGNKFDSWYLMPVRRRNHIDIKSTDHLESKPSIRS